MATKLKKQDRTIQLEIFASLPDTAFVDIFVVMSLVNASNASIRRWSTAGYIPEPVRFGRSVRWKVGALRESLGLGGQ